MTEECVYLHKMYVFSFACTDVNAKAIAIFQTQSLLLQEKLLLHEVVLGEAEF